MSITSSNKVVAESGALGGDGEAVHCVVCCGKQTRKGNSCVAVGTELEVLLLQYIGDGADTVAEGRRRKGAAVHVCVPTVAQMQLHVGGE